MSNPIGPDMSLLENMYEEINHPSHYNPDGIEAISVIEDWNLNFSLGSVIKYICRYNRKRDQDPLNDLRKARWYLNRHLEQVEAMLEPKATTLTPTKEELEKRVLTPTDRDLMLNATDDLWKCVLARITNPDRLCSANRIAKAVSLAFQNAFRAEFGEWNKGKKNAT